MGSRKEKRAKDKPTPSQATMRISIKDQESLKRNWKEIEKRMRTDPQYMPLVAIKNFDEILRICTEDHGEYIGEFDEGNKICLDGFFVIDELEAILMKMKEVGCKQSHEPAKRNDANHVRRERKSKKD